MRRARAVAPWTMCALIMFASLFAPRAGPGTGRGLAGADTFPPAAQPLDRKDSIRCVRYEQAVEKGGVSLRFSSHCDERMTCTLRWTLRCEGERRRRPDSTSFSLAVGERFRHHASAAECGDRGWEVRDITWSCKTASN